MSMSVTWRDRVIEHPILRGAAIAFVCCALCIFIPIGMLMMTAAVIVTLPLHLALIVFRRRGFYVKHPDGRFSYRIDSAAFDRAG